MADLSVELSLEQWAYVLACLRLAEREFGSMPYSGPQQAVAFCAEVRETICSQLGLPR